MILKSLSLVLKVVVATATHSEKIAEEVQAFVEGFAKKNPNKSANLDQENPDEVRAVMLDAVEKSESLSPEAKKSIEDFLQKKNTPLHVIAAYVFDSEDEVLQSSEIVQRAVDRYGKNPSSVLPAVYADPKYGTLEKVGRGTYRLGPNGKAAWAVEKSGSLSPEAITTKSEGPKSEGVGQPAFGGTSTQPLPLDSTSPNDPEEDRDSEELSETSEDAPRDKFRRCFWEALLEFLVVTREHTWASNLSPSTAHYLTTRFGRTGVSVNVCMARGSRMQIELYLWNDQEKKLFDSLYSKRAEIEAVLSGESVSWERLDHRKASRIAVYRSYAKSSVSEDTSERRELFEWIERNLLKLREVAKDSIK